MSNFWLNLRLLWIHLQWSRGDWLPRLCWNSHTWAHGLGGWRAWVVLHELRRPWA